MADSIKTDSTIEFHISEGNVLPIGISKTTSGVNFSASLPDGKEIGLFIYRKGEKVPCFEIPFEKGIVIGNLWAVQLIDFDWTKYEYNFSLNGKTFQEKYAKRIVGTEQFGKKAQCGCFEDEVRCGFPFEYYDWEGDTLPNIPLSEVIAYNLHVRGFTMDVSSGTHHRGTFLGIIEKLPYLCDLGVNQIQLMPAYEFQEVVPLNGSLVNPPTKINYWGYGSAHFFAPKTSYSAGNNSCVEFKDMIKACHKAGIEVIMEFYFPAGTEGYLIQDCVRYWTMEYHVDGFRLYAEDVSLDEILIDPILANLKIYCNGFSDKGISQKNDKFALCQNYFTNVSRKLLRGDEDQLRSYVYAATRYSEGVGILNTITNHDGFTLHDLVSYDEKHNESNNENNLDGNNYNYSWNCGEEGETQKEEVLALRNRQMKNAMAMLYLSQGIPMLLAGDELANSQNGNNNAYCHDNSISWIHWNQETYPELQIFIKKLISFRKKHPVLWKEERVPVMNVGGCGFPRISFHGSKAFGTKMEVSERHIGIMYCEKSAEAKEAFDILFVAYNLHRLEREFELPKLPKHMEWCELLNTSASEDENTITIQEGKRLANQQILKVKERTVVLLAGRYYENK